MLPRSGKLEWGDSSDATMSVAIKNVSIDVLSLPAIVAAHSLAAISSSAAGASSAPNLSSLACDLLIKANKPRAVWTPEGDSCFEYRMHTVMASAQPGDGTPAFARAVPIMSVWPSASYGQQLAATGYRHSMFHVENAFESFAGLVDN